MSRCLASLMNYLRQYSCGTAVVPLLFARGKFVEMFFQNQCEQIMVIASSRDQDGPENDIFFYLKSYPTLRMFALFLQQRCIMSLKNKIHRCLEHLAQSLCLVINNQWKARKEGENTTAVSSVFGHTYIGSVDTFPVKILRPKSKSLRLST